MAQPNLHILSQQLAEPVNQPMQTLVELGAAIASVHTKLAQQHEAALCYVFFPFALPYADTSDCLLSSLLHPLTGPLYFYDLILLMRSYLATSRPVRYTSSVAIRSTMYDTYLRATHTTTSSIGGVQIPIYLVSSATDSV